MKYSCRSKFLFLWNSFYLLVPNDFLRCLIKICRLTHWKPLFISRIITRIPIVSRRGRPSRQKVSSLKGICWNGAWQADLPSSVHCPSDTSVATDPSISHYRIWLHPVASWQATLREMWLFDPMLKRYFRTGKCRSCQKLPPSFACANSKH